MMYGRKKGQPILVKVDMCGAHLIYKATLNNSLTFVVTPGKRRENVDKITNMVDLEVREEETLQNKN